MLEMQFLKPHTKPTESESVTAGGVRDGGGYMTDSLGNIKDLEFYSMINEK